MIATEAKLWRSFKREAKRSYPNHKYTRIETGGTVDGVSDISYTTGLWSGWIELKTAYWPATRRPFRLHSGYTLAQCAWQIAHHNLSQFCRSWMLIGIEGERTWAAFVLVPAPLTTHLIEKRKGPDHQTLLTYPGVVLCYHLDGILSCIEGNKACSNSLKT